MRNRTMLLCVTLGLVGVLAVSCSGRKDGEKEQLTGMSLVFDATEAEFQALSPLLSMSMDEQAKATIRARLIFCVMLMQSCVDRGTTVTRERPSDGFETRKVTQEWIRKYVEQVSKYPEWENRQSLLNGVLVKTSG
jgi:hypothetical protein